MLIRLLTLLPPHLSFLCVCLSVSSELKRVCEKYPPAHPVHEMAARTPHERLMHFAMFFREHKKRWHVGRWVKPGLGHGVLHEPTAGW
jgi:hypothetical protein